MQITVPNSVPAWGRDRWLILFFVIFGMLLPVGAYIWLIGFTTPGVIFLLAALLASWNLTSPLFLLRFTGDTVGVVLDRKGTLLNIVTSGQLYIHIHPFHRIYPIRTGERMLPVAAELKTADGLKVNLSGSVKLNVAIAAAACALPKATDSGGVLSLEQAGNSSFQAFIRSIDGKYLLQQILDSREDIGNSLCDYWSQEQTFPGIELTGCRLKEIQVELPAN